MRKTKKSRIIAANTLKEKLSLESLKAFPRKTSELKTVNKRKAPMVKR